LNISDGLCCDGEDISNVGEGAVNVIRQVEDLIDVVKVFGIG